MARWPRSNCLRRPAPVLIAEDALVVVVAELVADAVPSDVPGARRPVVDWFR